MAARAAFCFGCSPLVGVGQLLHELDPDNELPARDLRRPKHLSQVEARLATYDGLVARLAGDLVASCRQLTERIHELDHELDTLVAQLAPTLLSICGCATLTAAKILGETADVRRFRSGHAFARRAAARVVQQPSTTPT
jgi:transposase